MRKIIDLDRKAYFLSCSAVGGYHERRSMYGASFDFCDDTDKFGMKSFEMAEGEMCSMALKFAMKKAAIDEGALEVVFAGDLQNQCTASAIGLYEFGIPYIGLYSACSTATEAILLLSSMISAGYVSYGAAITSSHNSAAERQFRTPIEYGAQRTPSSQWTATAAGAFILTGEKFKGRHAFVDKIMIGKAISGLTKDASNMGAAMARAAYDSIYTFLSLSGDPVDTYDAIVTGDLGKVGSDILHELLDKDVHGAAEKHLDCGVMLYDTTIKGVNSGASGCGCSASMLAAHFIPKIESADMKKVLFLSTGALMSPGSVQQQNNILGIAPAILLKGED